jgi:hypothetical protein
MRRPILSALLCTTAGVTAAGDGGRHAAPADPAADFTHAYYTRGCGPVDQPATMIYLTRDPVDGAEPQAPYVQIWFAGGRDEHGRYAGQWTAPQSDAGGTWCRTPADCRPVTRGSIRLERSTAEGTLNGHVELDLDGPVGGPLRALPLPSTRLSCG